MITDFILALVYYAVRLVLSPILLLPSASLPSWITTPISTVMPYAMIFDVIVPIATLLLLLGVTVAFESQYFLFKGVYWLIRRLPTQS